MNFRIKHIVKAPQFWMSVGGLFVAGSLLVGYHNAQMTADRVMALKSAPPGAVVVQDFKSDEHSNASGEMHLIAEANLNTPLVIQTGRANARGRAMLLPIFPVSDAGRRLLEPVEDTMEDRASSVSGPNTPPPVRPKPRNREVSSLADALGFLYYPLPLYSEIDYRAEDLVTRRLGPGLNGTVVVIHGAELIDDSSALVGLSMIVKGALIAKGRDVTQDMLIIEPFVGTRAVIAVPPFYRQLQNSLFLAGLIIAAIAAYVSVRPSRPMQPRRSSRIVDPVMMYTRASKSTFQPIATQDEIYTEDEMEEERQQQRPRALLILDQIRQSVFGKAQSLIKSRQ